MAGALNDAMTFDDEFRARLLDLFTWRRDVRRFRAQPLPPGALDRLIGIACLAPSVGLSQPWRFVVVEDVRRRERLLDLFRDCNAEALATYTGDRARRYAELRLAGIAEAPAQVTVFTEGDTQVGYGLGRRTMPEMAEYSTVTAVHTMWLAARAEGIGLGWVSILDPVRTAEILDVPQSWRLIGHFCLGYPEAEADSPELEQMGWERRRPTPESIVRR